MKTWTPFTVTVIISVLANLFPAFMAFVVKDPDWAMAGWAFYFYLIPGAIVLISIGLITSLVLHFKRKA